MSAVASSGHRPPMPETALAAAFLTALVNWARREAHGSVALPNGRVDREELARVIVALLRAREESVTQ